MEMRTGYDVQKLRALSDMLQDERYRELLTRRHREPGMPPWLKAFLALAGLGGLAVLCGRNVDLKAGYGDIQASISIT